MLERAAAVAGLEALRVHPHMLRHACGFALANQGVDTRSLQAYLGHRHNQNTVRYAELSPGRFIEFLAGQLDLGINRHTAPPSALVTCLLLPKEKRAREWCPPWPELPA